MSAPQVLNLIEWQPVSVDLATAQALSPFSSWFEIGPTAVFGVFVVRAKNVIGVIPIGDLTVRIAPKLPIASLVAMLEEVYDLPSLELHESMSPMGDVAGLLDRFAAFFARRILDRLRTGIYRTYVSDDDELMVVRGRIDIAGSIRAAAAARPHLRCEYEDLTVDIFDNQILLAALDVLRRVVCLSDSTRSHVHSAYRSLASDVTLVPVKPADCLDRHYDRLNIDYKPLHALARFFLSHATADLAAYRDSIPFTLNTALLFEAFVARWLSRNLPPDLRVDAQRQLFVTTDGRFESRIDLVVSQGETPLAVLDTKYKDAIDVDRNDLHQIVYYATGLGCRSAFLVYPTVTKIDANVGNVRVHALAYDLSRAPAIAGAEFLSSLLPLLGRLPGRGEIGPSTATGAIV